MADRSSHALASAGLRLGRGWRWALYFALAGVLWLGYLAYQQPAMVVLWQDFLTLCGIG